MRLNIITYQYRQHDGYGRFAAYLAKALIRQGIDVHLLLAEQCNAPGWMHERWGIDWSAHAVSILPPFYLQSTPPGSGPHWLYTMTEGSALPAGWERIINASNVERVIVPCQHNADVFYGGGVLAPIDVVPGGTDPDEFRPGRICADPHPYTFLALADRGARKGWSETWQAFYKAFGGPTDTPDVRLIIKARPNGNDLLELISRADNPDPRITIVMEDMDMREFYRLGDCYMGISRSEGWGMPMREAASCGLPVITQAYSGMDDGFTHRWATITVGGGRPENIPAHFEHIAGQWLKADVAEVAAAMRWCYASPDAARKAGLRASRWIAENQTWDIAAQKLITLIEEHHG